MISSRDINELNLCLQRGAKELKRRMSAYGYPMGISSTYRDNEAQDALYEQGRTKPGNIVTNARGGESVHNYRLAFDIFLNIKGQEYADDAFFDLAGKIWTEMGGEWGGNWKGFADRPHFEYLGGLSLTDLQKGKYLADDAKMKWEEQEADEIVRYKTLSELPEWAKPTIEMLIDKGYLFGNGEDLDLSQDMCRIFTVLDRSGVFE